ncbi:DUF3892 domain-containing protein [Effusibacillus dendaii]|uniref:DUF3892 domain-containing protein n=1 Tax=Effusibacillus dendaii TaxID=2743772 RepID=A0A7I8DEX2_9BACL|nr:DUF3892 domain-containing protein [Effusibacillus dendaii]BCJ87499.1 hypothetical protein skT53_24840 [Effusibacillus dendaii]
MIGEKIVAIQKDDAGNISKIKTHTGRILGIEEAKRFAAKGGFDSLTSIDEEGNWYIERSAGDGKPEIGGNLTILPEFE